MEPNTSEENKSQQGRWRQVLFVGAGTALGAGVVVVLFSDNNPILWTLGAGVGGSLGAALRTRVK